MQFFKFIGIHFLLVPKTNQKKTSKPRNFQFYKLKSIRKLRVELCSPVFRSFSLFILRLGFQFCELIGDFFYC